MMAARQRRPRDTAVMDLAAEKIKMDMVLRDTAQPNLKSKRSFDFKMCKKVAELTQVVHMLFTRNHEKEVEMECLRDAYEQEIHLIISDAKGRIARLDRELLETRKNSNKEASKLRDEMRENIKKLEMKYLDEVKIKDAKIIDLERENVDLKKQLSLANETVQKFEEGASNESQSLLKQLKERDAQLKKLEGIITIREELLHEKEQLLKKLSKQIEQTEVKLMTEVEELKKTLSEVNLMKENLSHRNRQLEDDLKMLKKELRKRLQSSGGADSAKTGMSRTPLNLNEEIERLKREIKWYRMELCNREGNFNRVFAENRPVRLDTRGVGGVSREKTLLTADEMGSSISFSGREARLPVLGMDHPRRPANVNVMAYSSTGQRTLPTKDCKAKKIVPNH
ncbi:uncharacterized protein LOC144443713 [Glandiceps talaboti]